MDQELDKQERECLQNMLRQGETLQWTGRRIPRFFDKRTAAIFASGLFSACILLGFFLFFFDQTAADGGIDEFDYIFAIATLPAWGVQLVMIAAPLRHRSRSRRTFYAITDKRAIVCSAKAFGKLSVKDFPLATDMVRECKVKRDGSGDLIFAEESVGASGTYKPPVGFLGIPRLRETQETLLRLAETKRPDTTN